MNKILLKTINDKTNKTPIWLMRQAGRYLPEYRKVRASTTGFLDLCFNPVKAAEVTIQPLRRFDLDAAILFSDILVIPYALGQKLEFVEGEGPKLDPIKTEQDILNLDIDNIDKKLANIYETINIVKGNLDKDKTFIGFAGSPWTVAAYMIEGHGSKTFLKAREFSDNNEEVFQKLIDIIVIATVKYLKSQIKAGVDTIQLFDSWAGLLPADQFNKWVVKPTQRIVDLIKEKHNIPIIGFPKGSGINYINYIDNINIDVVGLDMTLPTSWIKTQLQPKICVQGNLDPLRLLYGGYGLEKSVNDIMENLSKDRFIFNLGHGIIKETPIENVEKLIKLIRSYE